MRLRLAILTSTAFLALSACQSSDLGTGANTLDREYARPAHEAWKAAVGCAESAGFRISSDRHDRFGGELVACRAHGDEVRIDVRTLSEQSSQVSIRVEPGDRVLATLLHERMAEKLGLASAKAGLFGGGSCDGTYSTDLDSCLAAARRTFAALQVSSVGEEVDGSGWKLDGRLKDSRPVRITGEKKGDLLTRVTFVAGTEKKDADKAFAKTMRDEFEATIHLEANSD